MKKVKSLAVFVINFNCEKYLPEFLKSLRAQTLQDFDLFVIDNGSSDQSVKYFRENPYVSVKEIVETGKNLGYSAAANLAYFTAKALNYEFLMIANCDLVFDENYLENCFSRLQKTPCAAICGKLKIYNFETQEKTNLIDSTGLEIFKNRRVVDANQGVEDKGQFDVPKQVFGISGTCPIYRVAALQKAEIELGDSRVEVFDEDFFMYKEDIDLSWRLNLLGEQIFYEPSAVAWHVRGTGILRGVSHYAVLRDRRKTNAFTKFLALKNQRLMLIKNEYWVNFFLDAPRIFLKEFLVFSYVLFCEILLLKAYLQAFVLIPKCLKKRKQIMRKAKISALEMRRFFN